MVRVLSARERVSREGAAAGDPHEVLEAWSIDLRLLGPAQLQCQPAPSAHSSWLEAQAPVVPLAHAHSVACPGLLHELGRFFLGEHAALRKCYTFALTSSVVLVLRLCSEAMVRDTGRALLEVQG